MKVEESEGGGEIWRNVAREERGWSDRKETKEDEDVGDSTAHATRDANGKGNRVSCGEKREKKEAEIRGPTLSPTRWHGGRGVGARHEETKQKKHSVGSRD